MQFTERLAPEGALSLVMPVDLRASSSQQGKMGHGELVARGKIRRAGDGMLQDEVVLGAVRAARLEYDSARAPSIRRQSAYNHYDGQSRSEIPGLRLIIRCVRNETCVNHGGPERACGSAQPGPRHAERKHGDAARHGQAPKERPADRRLGLSSPFRGRARSDTC